MEWNKLQVFPRSTYSPTGNSIQTPKRYTLREKRPSVISSLATGWRVSRYKPV